jgi:RHS repeat-associated protein
MADAVGTTRYTYDAVGQLLSEDGPFTSDTVTNTYSNRRRLALSLQQPTGTWTNGFGWDLAGRLTNVTSAAGAFGYAYTALDSSFSGRLVQRLSLPNGASVTNNFDPVARLLNTVLKYSNGTTTLDAAHYGYNEANQRIAYTNANQSLYYHYSYDPSGQLTVGTSSTASEDRGYAYDAAWNLNYLTNNGALSTFMVDGKNELTNALGAAYGYDSNGNLTAGTNGHNAYVYDDENRLIQWFWYATDSSHATNGALRTDFYYDGMGRLRERLEYDIVGSTGGGGTSASEWLPGPPSQQPPPWTFQYGVLYLYDGMRVIQERDTNNTPLVSYTRGLDLSGSLEGAGGIGGLLARSSGYSSGNWSTNNVYHADGNGNITFMLNSSQTMVASYRYDPFGITISSSGSLAAANTYRFSSKEFHLNSAMYYYGYRFYDPSLQRWINRDPLGEEGFERARGSTGGHFTGNLYLFVSNNGISKFDPQGLKIWLCTVHADPPFPRWSTHSYLWDDRSTTPLRNRECGMESSSKSGSSGNSSGNTGPGSGDTGDPWHGSGKKGPTECYPVDDSDGKEDEVMACCKPGSKGYHMNDGIFAPYSHDCHDAVDNCLKAHGLSSPPHSRGDPISNHVKDIECCMRDFKPEVRSKSRVSTPTTARVVPAVL